MTRQTPPKSTFKSYMSGVYPMNVSAARRVRRGLAARGGSSLIKRLWRVALHDAIFEVENEIESKGGGHPDDPTVVALNRARNMVLDDLGWNE